MLNFLITFFTVILVLLSGMIVVLVLMQRASSNSAMGASLGGGAAESAFGADSGNILTRWTIYLMVAFFILSFGLYLAHTANIDKVVPSGPALPELTATAVEPDEAGSLTRLPVDEAASVVDSNASDE